MCNVLEQKVNQAEAHAGSESFFRISLTRDTYADSIQAVCQDDVLTVVVPMKPPPGGDTNVIPGGIEHQTYAAPTHESAQS